MGCLNLSVSLRSPAPPISGAIGRAVKLPIRRERFCIT
nr:MAG TPA: hypothetical protein [Caudoviricetes sp.]